MILSITATWQESWKDHGSYTDLYEIPDRYMGDEGAVTKLFERIAYDFSKETDDPYALDEIYCGFDWGSFSSCIGNDFLWKYGVRRLDSKNAMSIDVMHDECFVVESRDEEE